MIVAIRNATGIDLHLAITASRQAIRFRVTLQAPDLAENEETERLRPNEGFGMTGCPEGIHVKIDASATGMAIRAIPRREVIDKIDEYGQLDGTEMYLELTLRLTN